jgi:hypothetical protein
MPTNWTLSIDWDRNGNYTGTHDNITARVIQCNWFLGMRKPFQETADNSLMTIVLNNADRLYSPDYAGGPLYGKLMPQRRVRITSFDGTTERTHWVGWIEAIQPDVSVKGTRLVKILATGAMQFYKAAETQLELQENKRSDEVISALIREVIIPPALDKAWILGRVGNSEVGLTTHLAVTTDYETLEPGRLTLGMAADNWVINGGASNLKKNTFDVFRAIGDITSAERGRFFFNRAGKAVFWNRHHLLCGVDPVEATFDNSMQEMVYSFAGLEECKNEVIVTCHPRTIGASADTVLWQLGESVIRVDADKPRTLYIKYEDEEGKRVGAREVTVHDVEYSNGSSSTATIEVVEKANGAELKFTAIGNRPVVITKCVLKGRKIVDSGDMDAKAIDQESIIDFGRRTMRINLPSIDNLDAAQAIADFERTRRSKPQGMVQSLTVLSHARQGGVHHQHQLAITIGSLIQINETQTGHNSKHIVMGEAHELNQAGTLWKTTWYLEPVPTTYPWRLGTVGRSELGIATRVTY